MPGTGRDDSEEKDDAVRDVALPPEGSDLDERDAVVGDTWTGAAESAVSPRGSELSLQDLLRRDEQAHLHRLQLRAAAVVGAMVPLLLVITYAAAWVGAIDSAVEMEVIHTLIAPIVTSGLIVIIAWLFSRRAH